MATAPGAAIRGEGGVRICSDRSDRSAFAPYAEVAVPKTAILLPTPFIIGSADPAVAASPDAQDAVGWTAVPVSRRPDGTFEPVPNRDGFHMPDGYHPLTWLNIGPAVAPKTDAHASVVWMMLPVLKRPDGTRPLMPNSIGFQMPDCYSPMCFV